MRPLLTLFLLLIAALAGAWLALMIGLLLPEHSDHFSRIPQNSWQWFETSYVLLGPAAFGIVLAAPTLFFCYFPLSLVLWSRSKRALWKFVASGTLFGTLNGIAVLTIFGVEPRRGTHDSNIGFIVGFVMLFAGAAFLTALFHWLLLTFVARKRPE